MLINLRLDTSSKFPELAVKSSSHLFTKDFKLLDWKVFISTSSFLSFITVFRKLLYLLKKIGIFSCFKARERRENMSWKGKKISLARSKICTSLFDSTAKELLAALKLIFRTQIMWHVPGEEYILEEVFSEIFVLWSRREVVDAQK